MKSYAVWASREYIGTFDTIGDRKSQRVRDGTRNQGRNNDRCVAQPADVLAQPAIENRKLADLLCELSTEDLRKMSGLILAELKRRSKTASEQGSRRTTAVTTPAPTAKEVDKAAAKEAYLSKKAEYVSRAFGVVCVPTGKQLKRRFADEADALAAAAGLSASMKRHYNVVQIAA